MISYMLLFNYTNHGRKKPSPGAPLHCPNIEGEISEIQAPFSIMAREEQNLLYEFPCGRLETEAEGSP